MIKHRSIFSFMVLSLLALSAPDTTLGQAVESDDQVQVNLRLIAPVAGRSAALPEDLTEISRQLQRTFRARDLSVVETYIGQISAARGSIDYKTIASFDPTAVSHPTFLNWELRGVEKYPGDPAGGFIIKTFRFQARYPIRIEMPKLTQGQSEPLRYETIGLALDRMSIVSGKPTVIGTLSLPNFAGTAFLVLSVTSGEPIS